MTSDPTKLTDTPPTTVWSNDVAGGGVEVDDIPGVAGLKEGQVSDIPASSSSKKKKKKKKQQQQQQQKKDKVEEGVKAEGDDDEDDAETPGIVEEVTEFTAMPSVTAPIDAKPNNPVGVTNLDEAEVSARVGSLVSPAMETTGSLSKPIEKRSAPPPEPETVEDPAFIQSASSASFLDPTQGSQGEDSHHRAPASAVKGDDLFDSDQLETNDFADILGTSAQDGGALEADLAAKPISEPIETEREQEIDSGTEQIHDVLAEPARPQEQGDDLFADEAGADDDLFGAVETETAHLFGSLETAAQGEPVTLESISSGKDVSAEIDTEAEELFSDQTHREIFEPGSSAEVTVAPLAVEESTEPVSEGEPPADLFSGTGDGQEEYFSQIVQAGRDEPDAGTNIPPAIEPSAPAEVQVEHLPAQAVGTIMNGDQPSPDPFGADDAEDDFFSRPPEEAVNAQEVGQLDSPGSGRARASTKTSDLFQTDEAEDVFANLGAADALGVNNGGLAAGEAQGKLDIDSSMSGENASVDNNDWMGQDALAAIASADTAHPGKADKLDNADLDLMGVPEGWVDGNGQWCWYTEDERMEVAKQMVADGTAQAPEKPFPSTTARQQEPIETTPPPLAVNPYVPSPAQSYAPSVSQSYTPYRPSPPTVAAAIPYVPSPAPNAYTPVPTPPYVSSAYNPSGYGTGGYTPMSSGSQSYGAQSAAPKLKTTPAPALERTKTSTAYDPPVITSRSLSRPPSAAPVLSQYTPMPMPITLLATTPVSPPPPAPGPPRTSLPPRSAVSIKSTLGGRSTPTAYDPPVPAMSRQASYARLRPVVEVAPPLPPLPPVAAPAAPTRPAPPPAPPRGPSRNGKPIQPPPAAGVYRPLSRARNETPSSAVPVPPVPSMPQGITDSHRSLPASATFASVSGSAPVLPPYAPSSADQLHKPAPPASLYSAPGPLPLQPNASLARELPPTASLLSPSTVAQAESDRLTPQRDAYDTVQADATWPPQNVSPAKNRPILRQDTFQPPTERDELLDPEDAIFEEQFSGPESGLDTTVEQEQQAVDPYKPLPTSAPAASTYTPAAASNAYQSSPIAPYQPLAPDQMTPSAYLTPTPNGFAFPTENFASPPNSYESPGVSNYAPAPENVPKSLSEDVLERASEKAKRVPCVSFGPQGQLLVVFQSAIADPAFSETGQRLLPAYGDTSRSQKVQLHPLSDILSGAGDTAALSDWPGPLFVEGATSKVSASAKKKRDAVNAYIDTRVQEIQSGLVYLNASKKGDAGRQSAEARMVMLQIIKLMIAADGKTLTSDPTSKADLVELLAKHLDTVEMESSRQRKNTAEPSASSSDLQYLSRMLVKGQQQEAQQYAMQQQLWSHALLISSVMGPQAWQACVDAFVAQSASGGAELAQPLVTAYKLFGGTQQLAPAANQNSLWRDTVATVVANVKAADVDTLVRLADQLKQNNLVEASHLCFMLSPKLAEWASGSNSARVSLFGCRDIAQTARDLELSELLEYALSFRATPKGADAFHGVPQLLPYKLQRAVEAFTAGRSTEARAYVDAVLAQIRAQKVPNPTFAALGKMAEALSGRIAGIPVTAAANKKGGKPNLENLGSWFEGRLTKFIAGDEESDAKPAQPASTKETAAAAAVGPFSHYSAISSPNATPNLTRSSTYDSIAYQSVVPGPHTYRSGSAASYRPRQPSQLSMQRPTSAMSYRVQDPVPQLTRIPSQITEQGGIGSGRESELEPESKDPEVPIPQTSPQSAVQQGEEPAAVYQMPTWGQSYDAPVATGEDGASTEVADEESSAAFINPMQAFMTPMADSTSTPSYEPQATSRPAFDDEDEDDLGLGNSSKKKPSAQAEKPGSAPEDKGKSAYEPAPKKEEAVTPATAQKGGVQDSSKGSQSGSWLGKWWGGKKEETTGPGPIKAKLGEESAFYYDKELKRWINKTAGATEAPKAPPPPPPGPRATPASIISAPPSKPATPITTAPPGAAPPQPISRAPSVPAVGGPPSTSATARGGPPGPPKPSGMNAADPPLSDPLAAPPLRKGAAKGKKDLRAKYVNIM